MSLTTPESFKAGRQQIATAVSGNPGQRYDIHLESIIAEYERELFVQVLGPNQSMMLEDMIPFIMYDWYGWTRLTNNRGQFLKFKDPNGIEYFLTTGKKEYFHLFAGSKDHNKINLSCWNELLFGNRGHWRGLQYMAKRWVYCQYQKFHEVEQSVLGPMKPEVANATRVSNRRNYVDSWNELCVQYRHLQDFLSQSECFEPYFDMMRNFQTKTSLL